MAKNEIRIETIVDATGAKKGVSETSAELGKLGKNADTAIGGVSGKFSKAFEVPTSLGGLKKEVSGLAGDLGVSLPMAGAAGAAGIAEFALHSANKFADLASEVQKFSTVAGVSTQEASKFIDVGNEFGISSDELAGGVGKLGKALGNNVDALKKYGVSAVLAKDGSVDLEASTLKVIDAYNATSDAAKKNALGTAAFGKGYQALIPLLVKGSDEIKAALDKVPATDIMSPKQVAQGIAFKESIAKLQKVFEGLELTVGQQVIPVIEGTIGPVTQLVGVFNAVSHALPGDALNKFVSGLEDMLNPLKGVKDLVGSFSTHVVDPIEQMLGGGKAALHVGQLGQINEALVTQAADLGLMHAASTGSASTLDNLAASTADYNIAVKAGQDQIASWKVMTDAALKSVQVGLDDTKYHWDLLTGAVTNDQSFLHLEDTFAGVKTKGIEAWDASKTHAADAEQKARDYSSAVDDAKLSVINMAKQWGDVPISKVTTLLAEIDEGQVQRVLDQMQTIANNRKISAQIIAAGGAGYGPAGTPRAAGGPVSAGSTYLVGERGPEMFTPGSSGMITPNTGRARRLSGPDVQEFVPYRGRAGGGGVTNYITITVPEVHDQGRYIVEQIRKYERGSGPGWRN